MKPTIVFLCILWVFAVIFGIVRAEYCRESCPLLAEPINQAEIDALLRRVRADMSFLIRIVESFMDQIIAFFIRLR